MTRSLQVFAGERAMKRIQDNGLKPEDIKIMLAASGGPKWFVLSKLDQYLNQNFLSKAPQSIELIGSSIGAWRMACYAMKDPASAIKRLEASYIASKHGKNVTAAEVSASASEMVRAVLGEEGLTEILSNNNRHLNIVTALCKGWTASEDPKTQLLGVLASAGINAVSRKAFLKFYERVVFSQHVADSPFRDLPQIKGRIIQLGHKNISDSLMASGAIPLVLEGIQNIAGAPHGMYRDGGMVDYHFDLPLKVDPGIILYPHFSPKLKPGWFDKGLPWRKVSKENYSDVVLLTPTKEFIDMLPYGKIPDRSDFTTLDHIVREKYWTTAVKMGGRLSDELDELIASNRLKYEVKPLIPGELK